MISISVFQKALRAGLQFDAQNNRSLSLKYYIYVKCVLSLKIYFFHTMSIGRVRHQCNVVFQKQRPENSFENEIYIIYFFIWIIINFMCVHSQFLMIYKFLNKKNIIIQISVHVLHIPSKVWSGKGSIEMSQNIIRRYIIHLLKIEHNE